MIDKSTKLELSTDAPLEGMQCYVQPFSEVFNEDCIQVMKRYPDKFFDLAVVDPPYGIDAANMNLGKGGGVAKHNNHKKKDWDKEPPNNDYWNELFRVSKNQIVWGGNYYELPKTKGWIIWKKMDIKNDFNPIEMAWTSNLKMGFFDFLWCGIWQKDMKNKEQRIHPTQKPSALYDWIFANYAGKGNLILDTHLGSGSSRIAAHKAGLSFVGCEIDKDYFDAQEKRFKEFVSQLQLF